MSDTEKYLDNRIKLLSRAVALADKYSADGDFAKAVSQEDVAALAAAILFPVEVGLGQEAILKSILVAFAAVWGMGRTSAQDQTLQAGDKLLKGLNSRPR